MTGTALATEGSIENGSKNLVEMERKNALGTEMKKSVGGLHLVHVSRNVRRAEVREATTGRAVSGPRSAAPRMVLPRIVVPRIMAVAEQAGVEQTAASAGQEQAAPAAVEAQPVATQPKVELAFYRKYTEAMLRRYLRVSLEVGRVPSVMGREMFRGNVSHYKAAGLEDGVIFCVDMERCLAKLSGSHRRLIERIGLQGYTPQEAAPMLELELRRCYERYNGALDRLTELLLAGRLLEPQKCCQDVESV